MTLDHFVDVLYGYRQEPENWDQIFGEYQMLVKDEKSSQILSLLIGISVGQNQLAIMSAALNSLAICYNEKLAKELNILFPKIKFRQETIKRDIEIASNIMKSKHLKIKELKAELDRERAKSKSSSEGKTQWISTLVTLSKYQGYQINIKSITVAEYCLILNNFKEYQIALKNNGKQRENR